MTNIVSFVACVLVLGTLSVINCERIVLNEDDLINSCTGTCNEIPTIYGEHNCRKISGCSRNSAGWTRGFVRCDYCRCECERETGKNRDVLVEKKYISTNEDELFGTCTGTCSKSGVVRTNFKGCQKVEDCRKNRNGWTRGFVRCDYCTCSCVNMKEAASYTLENVKYDMSDLATKIGKPTAVAKTILENHSGSEQAVTRVLTFAETSSTSMTTSKSIETGLSMTVTASGGLKGIGDVSTSVERSLTLGFTTEAGKQKTESKEDQIQANIKVPPHSSISATVVGHRINIDIPYTADLVTTYQDGSKKTTHIQGVYNNVSTGQFRVQYSAAKKIKK